MNWKVLTSALAALLFVFASAYLFWRIFPASADGQTLAAWIQAIGSIAAIAGAFWIGKMQVADAHRIEERARQRSILAIAEAADEHAKRIGEAISRPEDAVALYNVYDKTIIDGMVRALSGAPVHEIGSRNGVLALLSLTDQFAFLGVAVEAYLGRRSDPEFNKMLEQYGSDEVEQRRNLISSNKTVLLGNVQGRLGKIREDYVSLKRAIDRDAV